jgi:hypothetical protein
MRTVSYLITAMLLVWLCAVGVAQEKKKEDDKKDSKTEPPQAKKPLLEEEVNNLYNPCGLAIQPGTGDVFIADSGHRRVLRYDPTRKKKEPISEEIIDFPKDIFGKGPRFSIGPLGLAFLNKNILVVADGSNIDGEELLRFYDVSTETTMKADKMKKKLGPIGPTPGQTEKGEGNFYAIAYLPPTALFITTNGDDTKGWIAKATLKDNDPQDLKLFIPTKADTGDVDAPVGIAISPDKKLVVGQMGENNKPKDSLLLIYDVSGEKAKLELKAETGLYDIVGLAYHPKSKNLYAVDYGWMNEANGGGLYRLTVSGQGAKAKVEAHKIDLTTIKDSKEVPAAVTYPTALVFDDQGVLYITEIVKPVDPDKEDDEKKKPGRLVRVVGLE